MQIKMARSSSSPKLLLRAIKFVALVDWVLLITRISIMKELFISNLTGTKIYMSPLSKASK